MKIAIVGEWQFSIYEEAVYQSVATLGHTPLCFSYHQYFRPKKLPGPIALPALRFQNKFLLGPLIDRINTDLVSFIETEKPDVVFVFRGRHIYPKTLQRLHSVRPKPVLVIYNHDDPFSPHYPRWYWRLFLGGVREYDLVIAFREHNVVEYEKVGAKRVRLLPRTWYIPELHRPVALSVHDLDEYACDVVFAGHYENDERLNCLEIIVQRGWKLNLFGPGKEWNKILRRSPTLRSFVPLRVVWGEDYNKAICGAKVALCFMSKQNRDTYTRRCFEIPAAGTLLLTEHSEDLAAMFKFGKEADSFRSPDEMIEKLEIYLRDDSLRTTVADAGHRRVIADGHDVASRIRDVVHCIEELMANRN